MVAAVPRITPACPLRGRCVRPVDGLDITSGHRTWKWCSDNCASMVTRSPAPLKRTRVVLVDSTRLNCDLLAQSLEARCPGCRIVGRAITISDARCILKEFGPHVAVIGADLRDGPLTGLDLTHEIRNCFPSTLPIVLLHSMEPSTVLRAFQAGAKGVFSREGRIQDLCRCIDVVRRGQIWAGAAELQVLLAAVASQPRVQSRSRSALGTLTRRELEIADLVAEGLSNRDISTRLSLSKHTVKNYLYRIYERLGISSRMELAAHILPPAVPRPRTLPATGQKHHVA